MSVIQNNFYLRVIPSEVEGSFSLDICEDPSTTGSALRSG
jgi:hypothetical protein